MLRRSLLSVAAGVGAATPPPSVIHAVIDDLGYHDPNFRNGQVQTPTMDAMVKDGVEVREFYVYKMCAPSRASVLSGRYPYHVGYYGNNGGIWSGVDLRYKLLPELLKPAGWATHALGKWHVGWLFRNYTPTWRGFDTFLGSSGNLGDYWYHFTEGSGQCNAYAWTSRLTDLVDAKTPRGLVGPANSSGMNGTYDSRLLTTRAVDIIGSTPAHTPMYLYFALHNVHGPTQAPLETVDRFPLVTDDIRKLTDAMLLEADWALGNVSAALQKAGRYDQSVFIVHTDNGGPKDHACNWPLRGGKFTFWEGGVRGLGFVSGPLLPPKVRGTQFDGMAHLADWYLTISEGIAGLSVPQGSTGPIDPDSYNMWPSLTSGSPSPRTEVVHLPFPNKYANTFNDSGGCRNGTADSKGCAPSMRSGKYKVIYTWPGQDSLITLAPLANTPVEYGKSLGKVRNGDEAFAASWKSTWFSYNISHQNETCSPLCLFDVSVDLAEEHNLAADPSLQGTVAAMKARLQAEAATGAPLSFPISKDVYTTLYQPIVCANVARTGGFWLPADWDGAELPPAPPNPPVPVCSAELRAQCPLEKYPDKAACQQCCAEKKQELRLPDCHPRDFPKYCSNNTHTAN